MILVFISVREPLVAQRTSLMLTPHKTCSRCFTCCLPFAGPYANFGPLADLVDSVVADTAGAAAGTAAAAAAEGVAGGLLAMGAARSSAAAADDSGSSKGHVPHKVALGYMLLPDYVQTAALNRWVVPNRLDG
jgi:hypothetical protein